MNTIAQRPQTPEAFVDADVAAKFLGINRRMLLAMARMGIAGAYAVGTGSIRRHWIFRISELTSAVLPASAEIRMKPGGRV